MLTVRPIGPDDHAAIHAVVEAAFGQPDEALLVDALRADGDALIELLAEEDGEVVGHILFSPMRNDAEVATVALAPVAVRPDRQGDGIGSMLIWSGIEACRSAGIELLLVLGHAGYYPRFGFDARAAEALAAPFSGEHFMALALTAAPIEPTRVGYAKAFGIS